MSKDEKYLILGQFIHQVMIKNLAISQIDKVINSPVKEIEYVNFLRSFIQGYHCPYRLAWDLNTRKVHFYITRRDAVRDKISVNVFMTNESVTDVRLDGSLPPADEKVFLNTDEAYVL